MKTELWDQEDQQALLRSLFRLQKSDSRIHLDDIIDDLNDANDMSLNKTTVKKMLNMFSDLCIIKKEDVQKGWYSARDHLDLFMNKKFGDVPTKAAMISQTDEDSSDLKSISLSSFLFEF